MFKNTTKASWTMLQGTWRGVLIWKALNMFELHKLIVISVACDVFFCSAQHSKAAA